MVLSLVGYRLSVMTIPDFGCEFSVFGCHYFLSLRVHLRHCEDLIVHLIIYYTSSNPKPASRRAGNLLQRLILPASRRDGFDLAESRVDSIFLFQASQ